VALDDSRGTVLDSGDLAMPRHATEAAAKSLTVLVGRFVSYLCDHTSAVRQRFCTDLIPAAVGDSSCPLRESDCL